MNYTEEAGKRIIVACDVSDAGELSRLAESLRGRVGCLKIGFQALMAIGTPEAIEIVRGQGGRIFIDGKFNDIPNTVAEASKALAAMGVYMFNVHASSGMEAMKAAVANKGESLVFAVTVLTSLNERGAEKIFGKSTERAVVDFAYDALDAGFDGIICSPQELGALSRRSDLRDLKKAVPGVRPSWASANDQKRIMTPREAIKAGADMLVIGRPITGAPNPIKAVDAIAKEMAGALAEMEVAR